MDSTWKKYHKKPQWLRPFVAGEDTSGISVGAGDRAEVDAGGQGGYVGINPKDPSDMWYVNAKFFADNYDPEPVEDGEVLYDAR